MKIQLIAEEGEEDIGVELVKKLKWRSGDSGVKWRSEEMEW